MKNKQALVVGSGVHGDKTGFYTLLPYISGGLFLFAFWVLYREFRTIQVREIIDYFHELTSFRLLLAIGAMLASYWMLITHDILAFSFIGTSLEYRRIALTSFIAYAFSNSVGYSFLSGGYIRYRFYSSWGISAVNIAKIIVFCIGTSIIGFLTVSGMSFIFEHKPLPSVIQLPVHNIRPVGIFFFVLLIAYLMIIATVKRVIRIGKFKIQLPRIRTALFQIIVASVDWVLASLTFYFLLPLQMGISWHVLLSIFMLAQFAGLVSHVPGGLGVFEMVLVLFIVQDVSHAQIPGTLLLFRLIYYFVPLLGGAFLLVGREIRNRLS